MTRDGTVKTVDHPVWLSIEAASKISDIANVFLVLSLALGVISTGAIVWMTNIKETYWDRSREEANIQIASAQVAAKNADATAAEARLELARIIEPRKISEQGTDLLLSLSKYTGQKYTMSVSSTYESMSLMTLIRYFLHEANWSFMRPAGPTVNGAAQAYGSGIIITVSSDADEGVKKAAHDLLAALVIGGIDNIQLRNQDKTDAKSFINILVGDKM